MLGSARCADIPAIRFPDTEPLPASVRKFGSDLNRFSNALRHLNDEHTSIDLCDDAIRSFARRWRELVCYFFDSMAQARLQSHVGVRVEPNTGRTR
jgi:hypothetical protein